MYPTLFSTPGVAAFAQEIDAERARQLAKFGDQRHPDMAGDATSQCDARETFAEWAQNYRVINGGTFDPRDRDNRLDWTGILLEEVYEALAEPDPTKLRAELIQVAAVCAAWVYDIDQRPANEAQQEADVVAYRDPHNSQVLLCRHHGERWQGVAPVTAEDLPDGGICTFGRLSSLTCGRDVLIPYQAEGSQS
jgi:hypothetical protein